MKNIMILVIIFFTIITLGCTDQKTDNRERALNITLDEFNKNRIAFNDHESNIPGMGYGFVFTDGIVMYQNETRGKATALIVAYPLPEKITENDIIVAEIPSPLNAGDIINVHGYILGRSNKGLVLYYIKAKSVTKTGYINITNADFAKKFSGITDKDPADEFLQFWIKNVYLNPSNGLSPLYND